MSLPRRTTMRMPPSVAASFRQQAGLDGAAPGSVPPSGRGGSAAQPPPGGHGQHHHPLQHRSHSIYVQDSVSILDGVLPRVAPVADSAEELHGGAAAAAMMSSSVFRKPHVCRVVVEQPDGSIVSLQEHELAERRRREAEAAAAAQEGHLLGVSEWAVQDDAKNYELVVQVVLGHARTVLRLVSGFTAGFSVLLLLMISIYHPVTDPVLTYDAQLVLDDIIAARQAAAASSAAPGVVVASTVAPDSSTSDARKKLEQTFVNDVSLAFLSSKIRNQFPAYNVSDFLRSYAPLYREFSFLYTSVSFTCVVLSLAPLAHSMALGSRAELKKRKRPGSVGATPAFGGAPGQPAVAASPTAEASAQRRPASAGHGGGPVVDPAAPAAIRFAAGVASHLANFQFLAFALCLALSVVIGTVEFDRQKQTELLVLEGWLEERLRICVQLRAYTFIVGWLLTSSAPPSFVRV